MATYYIEVDTYWQNSASYFVGPFECKADAEAWHQQDTGPDANVWYSTSTCGGNIRDAWRVYPVPRSKTEAARRGMRTAYENDNVIAPTVKPHATALDRAVRELRARY